MKPGAYLGRDENGEAMYAPTARERLGGILFFGSMLAVWVVVILWITNPKGTP